MPYSTVRFICLKFVRLNKDLKRLTSKKVREFKKIPPELQRRLLDRRLLELWAPYSIIERKQLLFNQWGLNISHQTLWEFYKHNDVKFSTGTAIYRKEKTRSAEIKGKRIAFAQLIANLMKQNKPVIFQDETTFTSWMLKAKSWSPAGDPIQHPRNSKRFACTVYGAIGNCLTHGVFTLGQSTNASEFRNFLLQVKAAVKTEYCT